MSIPSFLSATSSYSSPSRNHPLNLKSSLTEVLDWLTVSRCDDPETIEAFKRRGVDGACFFSLTEVEFIQELGIKFGPARKITRRRALIPAFKEHQLSPASPSPLTSAAGPLPIPLNLEPVNLPASRHAPADPIAPSPLIDGPSAAGSSTGGRGHKSRRSKRVIAAPKRHDTSSILIPSTQREQASERRRKPSRHAPKLSACNSSGDAHSASPPAGDTLCSSQCAEPESRLRRHHSAQIRKKRQKHPRGEAVVGSTSPAEPTSARLSRTLDQITQHFHSNLSFVLQFVGKPPPSPTERDRMASFEIEIGQIHSLLQNTVKAGPSGRCLPSLQPTPSFSEHRSEQDSTKLLISRIAINVNRLIQIFSRLHADLTTGSHTPEDPSAFMKLDATLQGFLLTKKVDRVDEISVTIQDTTIDLTTRPTSLAPDGFRAPSIPIPSSGFPDAHPGPSHFVPAQPTGAKKQGSAIGSKRRSTTISQPKEAEEESDLKKGISEMLFRRPTSLAMPLPKKSHKPGTSVSSAPVECQPSPRNYTIPAEISILTTSAFACCTHPGDPAAWKHSKRIVLTSKTLSVYEATPPALLVTLAVSALTALSLHELSDDGKLGLHVDARLPLTAVDLRSDSHAVSLVFTDIRAAHQFMILLDGLQGPNIGNFVSEAEKRKFLMLFYKDPYCMGGSMRLVLHGTPDAARPSVLHSPVIHSSDSDSSDSSSSETSLRAIPEDKDDRPQWIYSSTGLLRCTSGALRGQEYFWDGIRMTRSGSLRGDSTGDIEWNGVVLTFVPRSVGSGSLDRTGAFSLLFHPQDQSFSPLPPLVPSSALPEFMLRETSSPHSAHLDSGGSNRWVLQHSTFLHQSNPIHRWAISGAVPLPVMLGIALLYCFKESGLETQL